jgi:transketolase
MTIINPADANEAKAAVEAAINFEGPVYLRFGRYAVPNITAEMPDYKFELGRGVVYREGKDVTLAATGYMVHLALEAAEMLEAEGISAKVVNIHTIKPLDEELLISSAKETGAVVTAEEHTVIGGFGAAVCECLSENYPVPVLRVGVNDAYGRSGKVPELLEIYGLTAENIAKTAKKAIALKK